MSLLVVQHRVLYTMTLMMEHGGVVLADLLDFFNF